MAVPLRRVEDALFNHVLGEDAKAVEDAVIANEPIGEQSVTAVVERMSGVMGASIGDTLRAMGVSRTKASRNPVMNVQVLDRTGAALKCFARIAAMVGEDAAARWMGKANPHLEGFRPLDLLATDLGRSRLDEHIAALEDGAFL